MTTETLDSDCRVTIVKNTTSDRRNAIPEGHGDDSKTDPWAKSGFIEPELHPYNSLKSVKESDALRPNIDAMAHNVAGLGWQLQPTINFDSDNVKNEVEAALYLQSASRFESEIASARTDSERDSVAPPEWPDEQKIEETIDEWKTAARIEKVTTDLWLSQLCVEMPLSELLRRTVFDRESIGWGAWEVIRNSNGKIVRVKHMEAASMRLGPITERPVVVSVLRKTSKVSFQPRDIERNFRLIGQVRGTEIVYFKQLGDPRVVSKKTGRVYKNEQELRKDDQPDDAPATEVIWFEVPFPDSPYGMPRWQGMIPGITGSRIAQDLTVIDLDSSAIPRGLLLAMDTRLGKDVVSSIEGFFNSMDNARNRVAIIEAQTPKGRSLEGTGRVQLEWVSLAEAQHKDAQHQWYVERTVNGVSYQFRIPKIVIGQMQDFNRATAQAALEYVDEQVFSPERMLLAWFLTEGLLHPHGVKFHSLHLKGPLKPDKEGISKSADVYLKHGVLSPMEARPIAEKTLGVDLPDMAGDWQKQPLNLTLAGYSESEKRDQKSFLITGVDEKDARALAEYLGAELRDDGNRMAIDGSLAESLIDD